MLLRRHREKTQEVFEKQEHKAEIKEKIEKPKKPKGKKKQKEAPAQEPENETSEGGEKDLNESPSEETNAPEEGRELEKQGQ